MPELPEVETVMRGIEPTMTGATIARAESHIPALRRPIVQDFGQRLTGSRIVRVWRRAKYILATTSRGDALLLHLGMSGKITISPGSAPPERQKHDHIRWRFDHPDSGPAWISFNDARRFGVCDLVPADAIQHHPMIASLGPEPLGDDFTAQSLLATLVGKKAPMKAALLDQRVVAGLGNIYVAEALWRAGISPKRQAGTLGPKRLERLVVAIKDVLAAAIESGGSTLRDYVRSDGGLGYFQHQFDVYDQAGKPCNRQGCKGVIKRIVQSNRSTYYCPTCQR